MSLKIEVDSKVVREHLETAPKKVGKALLRGVTRGTQAARTRASRVVSKDMGVKVGVVRNLIRMTKPTAATLMGELGANLKLIPLIEFKARQSRRGVSYRGEGGRRARIPRAFIARMPKPKTAKAGHRGVYARTTKKRFPISELHGPSVGHVFWKYRPGIMQWGERIALEEFHRQLNRMLGGAA